MNKDELKRKYRQVFSGKEGKEVLKDILKQCRYGKFKSGSQEDILRQVGQEDTAIYILNKVYREDIQEEDLSKLQEDLLIF